MLNAWHLPVAPFIHRQGEKLLITLWLAGDALPEKVMLRYERDNEETPFEMKRLTTAPHPQVSTWQASIPLGDGQPRRRYCFKLLWSDRQQWFSPLGLSEFPPARLALFAIDAPDDGPQWVQDQVFYQIFPDRFARSTPRGAQQDNIYFHHAQGHDIILRDWHEPVSAEVGGSTFYGGDLDGIREKLPYLKKLGVTALYLNPIFSAPSVHKYDTADYRHVDPQFGGDEALLRLREKTREAGMRLILDGVFNHTGDTHPWFDRQNHGTDGACHHPNSPTRNWYTFAEDGHAFCWLGYDSLPKLDFAERGVMEEIYAGEESVVKHWLKAPWSIDGWRLDVVHMLGERGGAKANLRHVEGITHAAKAVNPQAFVFGEHFGDARQWLQNDVEDAAMNYRGFTTPVWSFLAGVDHGLEPQQLDAADCARWMDEYRAALSHEQQLRMFNQLDSHDTARFKTVAKGEPARIRAAAVWLFCWPGVPCVFYGDEVGVEGGNDPFCRQPFPWDKTQQDGELLALYQRLARLRHRSRALRSGACQVVYAKGDVLVFTRVFRQERVLVALNRGAACEITLPFSPLLDDRAWTREEGDGALEGQTLRLAAGAAVILHSR
ncbi:maltodextrin glucosidase [Cronobacter sakazakii]|uniref:maltodextrin glucosidase n=1 Tax=Cronobacter sakazakii TaxID=28141 RepID=UPI000CF112EC|nr:maltodextrin glucosidase [Cronobacter sakazakii]EIX1502497.1 maltodextrin glucosidase [Cronobacter sakazakii]EIX1525516.1 maltodextrin glucosidase [Cronobacter sakazakii]EIX1532996.1 maltodextrin glucosidase [Cronobacter sakazakii]EIX1621348.1 maltodextrin glucosidase [Cronobacter sakazakii]EIX1663829.1 maltodextrin glucosidase [Cronobacter sakazakii]